MSLEKILCLDDDSLICTVMTELCEARGLSVTVCNSIQAAQEALLTESFDLAFLDLRLPDGNGMEIIEQMSEWKNAPVFVVMTGYATIESAVECMRAGAFDYILKPFNINTLEMALDKADRYSQMMKVNRYYAELLSQDWELIGKSPEVLKLRKLISKVAPTDATVLITGESGTGKEVVARELYQHSLRRKGPFIKVNCAAISETLMESEMFGHEKGAFTGAAERRSGRFELASGGTLLLDEISEVSPHLQAKLLRVLQEKEFERVGGNKPIKVDVRIIATSNRNLNAEVQAGRFRKDLYYRLSVFPLHLPPLRERGEDKIILATHFLHQYARKHGLANPVWSDLALQAIMQYDWPGNVRELQNTVERAVILAPRNHPITPDLLNIFHDQEFMGQMEFNHRLFSPAVEGKDSAPHQPAGEAEVPPPSSEPVPKAIENTSPLYPGSAAPLSLEEIEKRHILQVLESTQGNRNRAAEILAISVRTLRNKIKLYEESGIAVPKGE